MAVCICTTLTLWLSAFIWYIYVCVGKSYISYTHIYICMIQKDRSENWANGVFLLFVRLKDSSGNRTSVILMRMLRYQWHLKNKLCIGDKFEPWNYYFCSFSGNKERDFLVPILWEPNKARELIKFKTPKVDGRPKISWFKLWREFFSVLSSLISGLELFSRVDNYYWQGRWPAIPFLWVI